MERPAGSESLFVRAEEALQLPLRLRIAWSAGCIEKVVFLNDESFVQAFRQREAINYAWDYALGRGDDRDYRRALMRSIAELAQQTNEIDFSHIAPTGLMLEEIDTDHGLSASKAVDYAALNYAELVFRREGIDSSSPAVSEEEFEARTQPFRKLARDAFEFALSCKDATLRREMFDRFRLQSTG